MTTHNTSDPAGSIEICGYITDPKRAGFQVLTNYECIYWRALVGNDAWALYEVLRSFCHEGETACFPSIRYLQDILGFKDKRALIGRKKIVLGRKYEYPGLLDILQEHDLIVAEVVGEKPNTRYVFHVNITPGMLSDAQLQKLPPRLREKHATLIARIETELHSLQDKKRAKRFANAEQEKPVKNAEQTAKPIDLTSSKPEPGKNPRGEGEIPKGGVGNSHPNNTQPPPPKTHHQKTSGNGQPPRIASAPPQPAKPDAEMVKLLLAQGVTRSSAEKLARTYDKQRILRQVRNLQHRSDRGEPIRATRGGKLRAMIEDDWPFLDDYKSPEQIAQEKRQKAERAARTEAEQARHKADAATSRQERKQLLQAIRQELGATDEMCEAWERRKKSLKHSLQAQEYMFFVGSYFLGVEGAAAVIGVHSAFIRERLATGKLYERLQQELSDLMQEVETVSVVVLDEALAQVRHPAEATNPTERGSDSS